MVVLNRAPASGSHLRDRRTGGGGGGLLLPCRYIHRTYQGMSRGDKILAWLTVVLLIANIFIVSSPEAEGGADAAADENSKEPPFAGVRKNLRSVKDKWDNLFIPPTPAPTMAPTEERVTETVEEITTKVAAEDWGVPKFEKPAECSADELAKVKSSGMDGSGCSGKPFAQGCSTSKMTKTKDNTWIEGFLDEVVEMRKDGKGGGAAKATFVAALVGNDCAKLSKILRGPKDAPESLAKWPWLWCSEPYESAETTKWGKVGQAVTGSNLDEMMVSRELREAIKDAVLIGNGDEGANVAKGGMNTMARTRYLEFDYDWKGAWESQSMKDVIDKLDAAGHTCYWAGPGKLWRLTGCWQEHYNYKTWSHLACAHRVLAPKLAERMEGVFKTTIGA